MNFFGRLFASMLVFAFGWVLFRQVLSEPAAGSLATILALAEMLPAMSGRASGGFGGGLRLFVRLGASIISWPIVVWLLQIVGISDRPVRIALAAAAASAAGVLAAGHGSGKDTARLWAVVAACVLPVYALMQAMLVSPTDPLAMTAGCCAVGVALLVSRQSIVWPHYQNRVLLMATAGVMTSGSLAAGIAFLHP